MAPISVPNAYAVAQVVGVDDGVFQALGILSGSESRLSIYSSYEEIKKAWRKKLKLHPDKTRGSDEAIKQVNNAKDKLAMCLLFEMRETIACQTRDIEGLREEIEKQRADVISTSEQLAAHRSEMGRMRLDVACQLREQEQKVVALTKEIEENKEAHLRELENLKKMKKDVKLEVERRITDLKSKATVAINKKLREFHDKSAVVKKYRGRAIEKCEEYRRMLDETHVCKKCRT